MSKPILQAIQVGKSFRLRATRGKRGDSFVRAVEGVSCELMPGEVLGLVGESGSGKSTLAKLLIGLLSPDEGEIRIEAVLREHLTKEQLKQSRRKLQFIFQNPFNSLNPRMTVEEIVLEPLVIHDVVPAALRQACVERLLESVHLPASYCRRLPRQLSGGECQRVGIARALATKPQLLICDEPIASLDVSIGMQILELLRRINQTQRTAILFISHDLRAVASLCQRILVMRQGRIVESQPTGELLQHPREAYTQLLLRSATLDLDAAVL